MDLTGDYSNRQVYEKRDPLQNLHAGFNIPPLDNPLPGNIKYEPPSYSLPYHGFPNPPSTSSSLFINNRSSRPQIENSPDGTTWEITDQYLPKAPKIDTYDPWLDGSCNRVYRIDAVIRRHPSGWIMRNTNNHNAAVLKKSCLGYIQCTSPGCGSVFRPFVCDAARKHVEGQICQKPGCAGVLRHFKCYGNEGHPVTHHWRHDHSTGLVFFQAKGFHAHPRPISKLKRKKYDQVRRKLTRKSPTSPSQKIDSSAPAFETPVAPGSTEMRYDSQQVPSKTPFPFLFMPCAQRESPFPTMSHFQQTSSLSDAQTPVQMPYHPLEPNSYSFAADQHFRPPNVCVSYPGDMSLKMECPYNYENFHNQESSVSTEGASSFGLCTASPWSREPISIGQEYSQHQQHRSYYVDQMPLMVASTPVGRSRVFNQVTVPPEAHQGATGHFGDPPEHNRFPSQ